MKILRWILPLLFIAVLSAAPTLPQQGASAISAVLETATDRCEDVANIIEGIVLEND